MMISLNTKNIYLMDAQSWDSVDDGGPSLTSRGLTSEGPRVVFSTAAFHARVRCSVPGLGGLNEIKFISPSSGGSPGPV